MTAPVVILEQPLKVQLPEQFDGMKGRVNMFIVQLWLYFGFQAAQFPTETSKTLYAASYLRGQAAEWSAGYLEEYLDNMETPDNMGDDVKKIFKSFENFKKEESREEEITPYGCQTEGPRDSEQHTLATTMGRDPWKSIWRNGKGKESR